MNIKSLTRMKNTNLLISKPQNTNLPTNKLIKENIVFRFMKWIGLSQPFLKSFSLALMATTIMCNLYAQHGYPYINDYIPEIEDVSFENYSIVTGEKGTIYIANPKGIIKYDGINWELFPAPFSPVILSYDNKNSRLLVGGEGGYGYLQKQNSGKYGFVSLYIDEDGGFIISDIVKNNKKVLFYSEKSVSIHDRDSLQLINEIKAENKFLGVFSMGPYAYVNVENKGIHKVNSNELHLLKGTEWFSKTQIITSCAYDGSRTLLGTDNSQFYIFDGQELMKKTFKTSEYIEGNILIDCIDMGEGLIAVATLNGGCLVIENQHGEKVDIINYQSGLPDDHVLSMAKEENGHLWICNEQAISYVAWDIPIRNYSGYPGLEGIINSSIFVNNNLYVATNEGVYCLAPVKEYKEVDHLVKKHKKESTEVEVFKKTKTYNKLIKLTFQTVDPVTKKKVPVEKSIPVEIDVEVDSVATKTTNVFVNEKIKKEYISQSVPFSYKKIEGLNAKCKQLIYFNNKLIVSSNVGLFILDSTKTSPTGLNGNINYLYTHPDLNNVVYAAAEDRILKIKVTEEGLNIEDTLSLKHEVFSIDYYKSNLWVGAGTKAYKISVDKDGSFTGKDFKINISDELTKSLKVKAINDKLYFFSSSNVIVIDPSTMKKSLVSSGSHNHNMKIANLKPTQTWIKKQNLWYPSNRIGQKDDKTVLISMFSNISDINQDASGNIWVVSGEGLFKIDKDVQLRKKDFTIYIRGVYDINNTLLTEDNIRRSYQNNNLKIEFRAPHFIDQEAVQYQYKVEGLKNNWSEWSSENEISFPFLPGGNYVMKIRALNVFNQSSNELELEFTIVKPFWKRWYFYLGVLLLLALAGYFVEKVRLYQLKKQNERLQEKVKMATKEIVRQKDEIASINHSITSSIRYALRIQEAMLPGQREITEGFDDSFILFRPRDIVGGDFYWYHSTDTESIIVASDCTGHGVPGGFMSMIGHMLLNRIVREQKITEPSHVLTALDEGVVYALNQYKGREQSRDGMDLTICRHIKSDNILEFASAKISIIYFDNNDEPIRVKGDRYDIGGKFFHSEHKTYTTHKIPIKGTMEFYIYSDGYIDQNDPSHIKKISTKGFKKILSEVHSEDMGKQKEELENYLDNWMDGVRQRDDIMVIGFRLKEN